MTTKNKNILLFILALGSIKLIALAVFINFYPESFNGVSANRFPAEDLNCDALVKKIINPREIQIHESIVKNAQKKYWTKKNGTFIGASYYKAQKEIFRKAKILFMDINSNFRPVYYIENDEASYPKIFKFLDSKSSKAADDEPTEIEKEITGWIKTFKSYNTDMENLVGEYASLAAYVSKIRELKSSKDLDFPFEIQLKLLKDGKESLFKDYIGGPEDLNNTLFTLKGKMKRLKGTTYFRFGAIDTRDLEQALLSSRLKSLENEIRKHVSSNPNDEELFKPLLEELIVINRDPEFKPTLKFAAKLEFKEMNAEYKDLFKNNDASLKEINETAKNVIENLSPRYQEKLGINAVKNWVTLMKAGRAGVVVGGIGTIGTGIGAVGLTFWNWINYNDDSEFDIINAKNESEFNEKLKKYLKGKYSADLIRRVEKKNEREMTLRDYNPKEKKDVEIVELVNGIISERRKFYAEEKLLDELEEKLSSAIEAINDSTEIDGKPTNKKPLRPSRTKPRTEIEDKSESDDRRQGEIPELEVDSEEEIADRKPIRTNTRPKPKPRATEVE